ncbi:MAG: hypothetical protein JWR84_1933 [Caulobacter sp.]|nr:hypothetical protein [Caulobacter sp.]
MIANGLIAALLLLAQGVPDYLANAERGAHECKVRSVFTHDNILVIGCENPTSDGIRFFAAIRGDKHFDEARDSADWALEKDRPLGILYQLRRDNDWRECNKPDCRGMIGVERR